MSVANARPIYFLILFGSFDRVSVVLCQTANNALNKDIPFTDMLKMQIFLK